MKLEKGDRIVFAGDSVTDMSRGRPVGEGLFENIGKGYVQVVRNLLDVAYPELDIRVTNMGNSGETSRDLLRRFDTDVCDLHPDWVSICIGINDVWRQFDVPSMTDVQVMPEEYEQNLIQMLDKLQGKVKGVFLLSPYYMEPNRQDPMRARMDEYVTICQRLAEKYGAVFVNFQKMYEQYLQYRHSSFIAWDRIHPSMAGATLMAVTFLQHIGFDFTRLTRFAE